MIFSNFVYPQSIAPICTFQQTKKWANTPTRQFSVLYLVFNTQNILQEYWKLMFSALELKIWFELIWFNVIKYFVFHWITVDEIIRCYFLSFLFIFWIVHCLGKNIDQIWFFIFSKKKIVNRAIFFILQFQPGGMPPRGPRNDWNRPPGNMQGFQGKRIWFVTLIVYNQMLINVSVKFVKKFVFRVDSVILYRFNSSACSIYAERYLWNRRVDIAVSASASASFFAWKKQKKTKL